MRKYKRLLSIALIAIFTISTSSVSIFAAAGETESGEALMPKAGTTYASDELIVVYKDGASNTNINRYIKKSSAVDDETATLDGQQKMSVIKLDEGEEVKTAITEYADSPIVDYVQPNYIYKLPSKVDSSQSSSLTESDKTWHLSDINLSGAKSRYNDAASAIGTSKVRVAVLDTGVDINHEDLQQCINKELSVKVEADGTYSPLTGDSDIFDGHGTHVCGIIGATADNDIGAKGVASSVLGSKLEVIAVDIFDFFDDDPEVGDGNGVNDYYEYGADTADIVNGLHYAKKIGADVINMSLGGYYDKAEMAAVKSCTDAGITVVAAAGNEGTASATYPADYEDVISVIATDKSGQATYWSNYGKTKDISAPGEDIYSTIPSTLTNYADDWFGTNLETEYETGGYALMSGTSMASPVVAGVAAILHSINGSASRTKVYNAICKTAKDIGPDGKDSFTGYGLINAGKAAEYTRAPSTPTSVKATLATSSSTSSTNYKRVKMTWNKMSGANGYHIAYKAAGDSSWTYVDVSAKTTSYTKKLTAGKKYYFKVRAYRDLNGRRFNSLYCSTKTVYTLKAPALSKITKTSKGNNQLKWTNINGESGYQVYKRKGKSGKWYLVKTKSAGSTTYIDTKINSTSTYYYKVRAYKTVKTGNTTKKVYSPWSTIRSK